MLPSDSEGVTLQHLSSHGKFQVELRVSIYRLLQRYVSRVGKLSVLIADSRLCGFRQRQKDERDDCRLELHRLRGVSKTGGRCDFVNIEVLLLYVPFCAGDLPLRC